MMRWLTAKVRHAAASVPGDGNRQARRGVVERSESVPAPWCTSTRREKSESESESRNGRRVVSEGGEGEGGGDGWGEGEGTRYGTAATGRKGNGQKQARMQSVLREAAGTRPSRRTGRVCWESQGRHAQSSRVPVQRGQRANSRTHTITQTGA